MADLHTALNMGQATPSLITSPHGDHLTPHEALNMLSGTVPRGPIQLGEPHVHTACDALDFRFRTELYALAHPEDLQDLTVRLRLYRANRPQFCLQLNIVNGFDNCTAEGRC